ncbi:hypothetical protein JOC85_002840 [Bacillus mesophilus]|uniref:Fur-regulated basic protein FbpA n=1 Tax=Bacillus mesophilus TaxID=1808955 RepID=A0A6M0Q8C3_9BACI|nr:hypothetical protein [Bacillus mesophilus]MBM7662033.1 hypothetical protein [Bacillus mesophilus]NEY72611.1 hypothetical protein [Bacillus mesophilus]
MTQLLIAVEKMKNYYIQKLMNNGILDMYEIDRNSYTVKELEGLIKKNKLTTSKTIK